MTHESAQYCPWQPRAHATMLNTWYEFVSSDAYEPVMTNLSDAILSVLERARFERSDHIDENWVRAYSSPVTTREECLGALRFLQLLGKPEGGMKFVIEGQMLPGAMDAVKAKKPRTHHSEETHYGRSI